MLKQLRYFILGILDWLIPYTMNFFYHTYYGFWCIKEGLIVIYGKDKKFDAMNELTKEVK